MFFYLNTLPPVLGCKLWNYRLHELGSLLYILNGDSSMVMYDYLKSVSILFFQDKGKVLILLVATTIVLSLITSSEAWRRRRGPKCIMPRRGPYRGLCRDTGTRGGGVGRCAQEGKACQLMGRRCRCLHDVGDVFMTDGSDDSAVEV